MNLHSNALKFTKQGGSILITAELIKSIKKNKEIKPTGKTYKLFKKHWNKDSGSDTEDSEDRKFNEEHGHEGIFYP